MSETPVIQEPPIKMPKRAFELELRVGGDSWDIVLNELQELVRHIRKNGQECSSVSGGYGSNHLVTITHDPSMTHDKYFEQLDQYIAARDAKKEEVVE